MAIGLGKMFGFDFMENFNYPYISTSIREFWRRWHISLSTWFREYLYIPLGGNRKGQVRTYVNLLIVFFATGLWHGAGATFIIWGLYHGLFLVVERMGLGKLLEKNCFRGLNHIYTALVVVVGWVFFRADTLADAKVILHQMFTWENGIYPASLFVNRKVIFLAVLGVLLSGIVQSICPKLREHLYEKEVTKTVDIVIMAVLLFLCTMYLVSSTPKCVPFSRTVLSQCARPLPYRPPCRQNPEHPVPAYVFSKIPASSARPPDRSGKVPPRCRKALLPPAQNICHPSRDLRPPS